MNHPDISIQHAMPHHYEDILGIYNHYVLKSAATFDCEVVSLDEKAAWFKQFETNGPYQLYVALDPNSKILGYACSTPFNERQAYYSSTNVSYYCHHEALGKGVGSTLLSHLMASLSESDIHKSYAGITLPNQASIRLVQKNGFIEEGTFKEVGYKFTRYWDVMWLSRHNKL